MRGSNDRVEVFKLSENLWFAGTAQLPPFEDSGNGGNSGGDNSGGDNSGGDNSGGDNSGGDNSGGDNSGGDNSGNHGNGNDNSGGDSSAGFAADGPRDFMESRKEELLARLRRGGSINEKSREALAKAANGGGARGSSASAPAAAPASAPAPAVDPLELQLVSSRVATGALFFPGFSTLNEQRLAEVGEFSARTTELKQVVKRKPTVGFPGISQYSGVNCGTPPKYNNSVVRVTPPDVALCVGNGYVLHTVNIAMVVYDKQGKQLTRIITQNEFFGLLPQVVEWRKPTNTSVFGDALGDMSCTYDRQANRFFLSAYWMSGGANNTYDKFGQTRRRGNVTVGSGLIVAATTTDDPTQPWNVFFIPGSNDGINSNPDWRAPLHFNTSRLTTLMDYPQIGTDAYGFYVSTNEFAFETSDYFGSSIYAISKSQLQTPENATILRIVVPYTDSPISPAFTIWPQKVAADGDYDYHHGGTMYFGWTAVNSNPGAPNETVLVGNYTTIGAFALTGTSALGTADAERKVEPHCAAVSTPPFFDPQPVKQKPGPVPLAWKMNTTIKPISPAFSSVRGVVVFPESRHMWVTFMSAFGKDMSASAVVARLRLSLRLKRKWRPFQVFLERFKVVGVGGGNSLIQPTIALNSQGEGIIAASLAGRSFYPSAAYGTLNANVDVGRINVAGPGKAPLDDFFGYLYGDAMRYGDYMTATVDEEGNAWAAVQYVAGHPRTEKSNWATFVFKVDLQGNGGNGDGGNGGSGGSGDNGGSDDNGGNGGHEGK
ncbi:unnamed protein product [Closterium sp. Yama58-4]|nr:unnamed protein product [Closterium sp. Yama58-4]